MTRKNRHRIQQLEERIHFPPWILNRLGHCDLNHAPLSTDFQHLAHKATPKAKAILVEADQVADEVEMDDELVGRWRPNPMDAQATSTTLRKILAARPRSPHDHARRCWP